MTTATALNDVPDQRYDPSRWLPQRSAEDRPFFGPRYFLTEVEAIFLREKARQLGSAPNQVVRQLVRREIQRTAHFERERGR